MDILLVSVLPLAFLFNFLLKTGSAAFKLPLKRFLSLVFISCGICTPTDRAPLQTTRRAVGDSKAYLLPDGWRRALICCVAACTARQRLASVADCHRRLHR